MSTQSFAKDTSNRTILQWIKGLVILFIGLTIAHLGVALFLLSNLGTDTFTILVEGLSQRFGLTVGIWHVMLLVAIMVLMLLTTKGYVKPGTIVCAFCGGWIIDLFVWLFAPYITDKTAFFIRFLVLLLGLVILSIGMSIVIGSNSGTGPNDLIAIVLSDKLNQIHNIQFRTVRIGCDIIFVTTGFLLGGTLGVGTVAAALLTGPLVQFFLPKVRKLNAHIDQNL